MRRQAGRVVTGQLVKGEDGLWREERPVGGAKGAPRTDDQIVEAFRAGATRAEITAAIAEEGGVKDRSALGTLYRDVDQVLLDAGIREKEEKARAPHRRDSEGEGALPALLEAL